MSFFELCVAGVGVCAQAAERRAHSRSSKKSKKIPTDGRDRWMEAAGVEPASENLRFRPSTCVAFVYVL